MKNQPHTAGMPAALGELAYRKLREAIQKGSFRPGDPVRERKVSEWLQISRTPVRDAIRRLQNEGYLTHKLHYGVVVAEIDDQGMTDLYALRAILEGAAAGEAARHATARELAAMQAVMRDAERTRSVADIAQCNYRFHTLIHQASHNPYLVKALDTVRESLVMVGRSTLVLPQRPAQVQKEHRSILAMMAKRNAAGAEKAMKAHIHQALENRFRLQKEADLDALPQVRYPLSSGGAAPARKRKQP